MADTIKNLAQGRPTAGVLTDTYTCPSTGGATISSITVCNTGSLAATFRISVAIAAAADDLKQYIFYDVTVLANDTFIATIGLTLANTDVVRCQSSSGSLAFNFFGVQIT